jgi:uncharacterized protein
LSAMRRLTRGLKEVAQSSGCEYSAKLVTNGIMLSHDLATELIASHAVQLIEVTLDGTSTAHDLRRSRKDGKPTFNRIFSNVENLAKRTDVSVKISVRCNVDRRNFGDVLPLINLLASSGLQRRIHFYIAPVHSWGNEAHKLALTQNEFADFELECFVQMAKHGFNFGLVLARKPIVCMAVKPHASLVDAYGSVFDCTEVSYVPAYGVPNRYELGTIFNGENRTRSSLGQFNSRVSRGELPCSTCNLLPVCGGSCPKLWEEGHVACPSAKQNAEERLLLSYALSRVRASDTSFEQLSGETK